MLKALKPEDNCIIYFFHIAFKANPFEMCWEDIKVTATIKKKIGFLKFQKE